MQNQQPFRRVVLSNVFWFLGSLVLAFVVWMLATSQSDPFVQWRLSDRVPIHVTPDNGLIITNQNEFLSTASVQLQGPRSVEQLLAPDDVIVSADLTGLGPGEHTVKLQWKTARQAAVVAISPSQITVELETQESQLKPVRVNILSQPPAGLYRQRSGSGRASGDGQRAAEPGCAGDRSAGAGCRCEISERATKMTSKSFRLMLMDIWSMASRSIRRQFM